MLGARTAVNHIGRDVKSGESHVQVLFLATYRTMSTLNNTAAGVHVSGGCRWMIC